jgi:hypothetical protein
VTITPVAASASSVPLLASNSARVAAQVYNQSPAVMYITTTATATKASAPIPIQPYKKWKTTIYSGALHAIWDYASGQALVTEI